MNYLNRFSTRSIVVYLSLLIFSGCNSEKQPSQPAQEATPQPTASASPTAGGAASTSFQKWRNSQIIDAFKAAGLEIENPRPMSKPKDYGAAPTIDTEATQFSITSLVEGGSGHIYNFASDADLEKMIQYYAKASTDNFSWVYIKDNILVQLDGRLPEEKAKQYEAALVNVK